ncbi:FecCD family ABC transporter permease [Streptomyces profundus]|uniref:FecCD family ABC transporter permease n=1 Tax=Streptomyces profundus TaxID=2867410 RepID=UPI001D166972|nr:iron ABC transporter permease [Streptomyces sp. MA3_2.13]UED85951.1 iron ABC transporter permease [Streptomyces sp. MA3_2.13]
MNRPLVLRLGRAGGLSRRLRPRALLVVGCAVPLLCLTALYGVTLGAPRLDLGDVVRTLTGGGDAGERLVVWEFVLPRVLCALAVGAALGLSGALFQSFARNPLVSPDILGVNSGAALVAVGFLVLFGGSWSSLPYGAFLGALLAALLVVLCSRGRGLSPYRLVLVGIGVDALCRAGVAFTLVQGDIEQVQAATVWMIGSLYGADSDRALFLGVTLALLVPLALALRRPLVALRLGEEAARSVGVRTTATRAAALVTATLLAAGAVAVCGPIAFVAFLAPHLARRLCRADTPEVLPVAMAVGAALVLGSDLIAQHAFPVTLPLGVVTPLLGGPYFLYLLIRANRHGEVA